MKCINQQSWEIWGLVPENEVLDTLLGGNLVKGKAGGFGVAYFPTKPD
jgi:hypothetical protein